MNTLLPCQRLCKQTGKLEGETDQPPGAGIHWTIVRPIHISSTSCDALFKQVLIKIGKQLYRPRLSVSRPLKWSLWSALVTASYLLSVLSSVFAGCLPVRLLYLQWLTSLNFSN